MASRGNEHIRRGRRAAAGAAVTALTTALGLAVGAAAPAQAAGTGWDPQRFALPWLPAPSVDGEISVTQVDTQGAGTLRTFRRDGTAAGPVNPLPGKQHVWGPAGDVVAGAGGYLIPHDDGRDWVGTRWTRGATQWSPFGDSLTESRAVQDQFMPVATGMSSRWSGLIPPGAHDPGPAAVTPDGYGVVVGVPATDVAGKRDLGLAAKDAATEYPAFPRIANKKVQTPFAAATPLGYGSLDARLPVVGPDGTLAFVGTDEKGPALYVDEGRGPVAVAPLGGDCGGQRPGFAPSGTALAFVVSSADCTSSTLTLVSRSNGTFAAAQPTVVVSSPAGTRFESASWRARTPKALVERVGGADRVATGVAVSQWGWDRSEGAVLTSSTGFADAVVGGPLAGALDVPLLITGPKALDSRVLKELKRLTSGVPTSHRVVHVIGGTGAVSAGVEKSLKSNGFTVQRHGGTDRYATSVAVARTVDAVWQGDPSHFSAFLADGRVFPDALSAGPAAVQMSAPVLLTNGATVPSVVRTHIAGQKSYTTIYGVGGPAATAATRTYGSRADGLYGGDRYSTNTMVVSTFFPGATILGYASGTAFPDALTGGALMGALGQPLVLTTSGGIFQGARELSEKYRAGTEAVLVFGGTGALSDTVKRDAALYAGNQTALWGLTSPVVPNPALGAPLANARPMAPGAGVGRLATNPNVLQRADGRLTAR